MKKMEIGRRVKKLLGQNITLETIAKIINENRKGKLSPKRCLDLYYQYMGIVNPTAIASNDLEYLIKSKEKIHLFGETGSGKTYLVEQIADLLNKPLIVSYARKEEDLVQDFGNLPFEQDIDAIFLLEGDAYYWRKYGLVRKYIQESNSAFIIITTYKTTPTKNITKHLTQVKKFPPTKEEVAKYFSVFDGKTYTPNDAFIKKIYDKNWYKVWRNYNWGRNKDEYETIEDAESISSKEFVYLLLKGNATYSDFERCEHPLIFILNWLGYNLSNFYVKKSTYQKAMSIVSFVDRNKYNLKQDYLVHFLLEKFPSLEKKGYLSFPPFQKVKEEEKESEYEVSKNKKEAQQNVKKVKEELGDFLLI